MFMFGKLKEKIKNWAKKVSEKETTEEKPEIIEETIKEELKEEIKEIPIPTKFEVGTQKIEPDLEKLKEKEEELIKETEEVTKEVEEIKEESIPKTSEKIAEFEEQKQAQSLIIKEPEKKPEKIGFLKKFKKETKEKPIEEQKSEKESFFKKISSKITKVKISEKEFEIYSDELETLLLENNVALEITEKIIKELKERIVGKELLKKEIESEIYDCFKEIIDKVLIEPFNII